MFVKVPYGGAYAMSELLTRMLTQGQIERVEIAAATPEEIGQNRSTLERWLPALTNTQTGVDWTL